MKKNVLVLINRGKNHAKAIFIPIFQYYARMLVSGTNARITFTTNVETLLKSFPNEDVIARVKQQRVEL